MKIKNRKGKYLTRASLAPRPRDNASDDKDIDAKGERPRVKIISIDENWYINTDARRS